MKKNVWLSLLLSVFAFNISNAQIICIYCYEQNDSISDNVNNLLVNGGFENHNCIPNNWFASSYCPNSNYYSCNITGWTCTGGGTSTYADVTDINYSQVVEGSYTVYFGSYYCMACSTTPQDTSCLTWVDCTTGGVPAGFPLNDPAYGGAQGLNLEQTVNGLTIGATYVLEFWAGGETGQSEPGLFAVDVGFGNTFFRNKRTYPVTGIGTRYIIEFNATATSHTIKFTNWGHICTLCTELILDDTKLYTLAELNPIVPPCAGANVTAMFSAPNHICPGTCTDFTNLSTNASTFLWSFPGGNPSVSSDMNPTSICYNTPGSYDVTLIANGLSTSDTLLLPNYITVYPWPAAQGILQNGDTLFANAGAVGYQWYENGVLIPGATNYFYIALESGNYNVVATDNNGCEVEAVIFDVIAKTDATVSNLKFEIYPNPAADELGIRCSGPGTSSVEISVYDVTGEIVIPSRSIVKQTTIDISSLAKGIYWVQINAGEKIYRTKFLKQ